MQILFGGTFDPIHNGHISLGLYISKLFNQLISLMPITGIPNYKDIPTASINDRLAMLKIIQHKYMQYFNIDYSEVNLDNYSPTIVTLKRKVQENGKILPMGFIIGGDSLISLDRHWDEWENLFNYTNFIVAVRHNYELSQASLQLNNFIQDRIITNITNFDTNKNGQILITQFDPVDISSTQIRRAIENNQIITEYLDEEIYKYIIKHNIYQGKKYVNK